MFIGTSINRLKPEVAENFSFDPRLMSCYVVCSQIRSEQILTVEQISTSQHNFDVFVSVYSCSGNRVSLVSFSRASICICIRVCKPRLALSDA
jgi:hypothetical protein